MTTCVHQGFRKRLPLEDMLDQSRLRFKKPIPPNPAPIKFATWLRGATQHKKARDPSMGKTNSGRNCQRMMPSRAIQKTLVCLRDSCVGFCLCFFCVSNRAVWHSLEWTLAEATKISIPTDHIRCKPWKLGIVDKKLPCDRGKAVTSPDNCPHEKDRDHRMHP